MDSQEELSLDFIEELLADPKTSTEPKKYVLPEYTSTYIKSTYKEQRCISRGCGAPTYILIKDEPFCTLHAIQLLGDLLDEKINHYPGSVPRIEKILEAYLLLSAHAPPDHNNINTFRIVIDREDHREFKVTVNEKTNRYPAYTSPEGVLIRSLLDML